MEKSRMNSCLFITAFLTLVMMALPMVGLAQEQSRESMALDSTATQWSLQFAYEGIPVYNTDEISPGVPRPEGGQGFLQYRMVAPMPKGWITPFTMLPRLTLRLGQTQDGTWGLRNSELLWLFVPAEWKTGRFGIGPLVDFPASSSKYGSTKWGFGLSSAVIQRLLDDSLLVGLLFTQTWGKLDPDNPNDIIASPLGIAPFLAYTVGEGFYLSLGDMVLLYNWQKSEFYLPLAMRVGKVIVKPKGSWNIYLEYKTSAIYQNWSGSALKNAYRFNVSYTIPL